MTYNLSTLEKLLGRYYKWWYLFVYEFNKTKATAFADFIFQFQVFTYNVLYVYVWSLSSLSTVIYLLTGRIFAFMTSNFWYNKIGEDIISGRLNTILLRPSGMFGFYFMQSLGARLYRNFISTVTIIVVTIIFHFFVVSIPVASTVVWVIVFIPIVFCINFLLAMLVGSIAFFIKDKRDFGSLAEAFMRIKDIFSGNLIEITLIPIIGKQLIYNPFALVFYHPTQVFLGKYTTQTTILIIIISLITIIMMYLIAKLIFRLGLKKNESVGL
jgi:ABC-2 type transport system permease protein